MMRRETYAEGSRPGDAPVNTEEVPISQEEVDIDEAYKRLETFINQRSATHEECVQAIKDIVKFLQ